MISLTGAMIITFAFIFVVISIIRSYRQDTNAMRQEQFDDDVSEPVTIQERVDRWIEGCYGPAVRILLWSDYVSLGDQVEGSLEEYLEQPNGHEERIDIGSHTGNDSDDQLLE